MMNQPDVSQNPFGLLIHKSTPEETVQALREAARFGFSQVQINLPWSPYTETDICRIEAGLKESGMQCPLVGVYCNPLIPDEPAWFNTSVRELEMIIPHLHRFGAKAAVIWTGSYAAELMGDDPRNYAPQLAEQAVKNISHLFRMLRENHVKILLEPWQTHAAGSVERLADACAAAPDILGCVFDIPNLIPGHEWNKQSEFIQYAKTRLDRFIGAVHLKDMDRDENGNITLPGPGRGCIDYLCLNAQLSHLLGKVPFVIEHVVGTDEILEAARFVKIQFGGM